MKTSHNMTTSEVAKRIGIHPSRVRRLAEVLRVGTKTDGGQYLFTRADYAAIESRSTGRVGRPRKEGTA